MKKKISKKKQIERQKNLKMAKKQKLTLILSAILPFALTITLMVLYGAFRIAYPWLFIVTALSWFALGSLFVYAAVKKWGHITHKGDTCENNTSVITIYNIVLLFALGVLFTLLFIKELL